MSPQSMHSMFKIAHHCCLSWRCMLAISLLPFIVVESFVIQVQSPGRSEQPHGGVVLDISALFSTASDVVLWLGKTSDNNYDGVTSASSFKIVLEPYLTDERTLALFAWVSCAIKGDMDERYNDLGLALEAIFGTLSPSSPHYVNEDKGGLPSLLMEKHTMLSKMRENALIWLSQQHGNDEPTSIKLSREERENNSLGPLGAGQWSGQYPEKYPHSILIIHQPINKTENMITHDTNTTDKITCVEDWIRSLPRTCRQTIRKAQSSPNEHNLTTQTKIIESTSPHSTLDHFKCILEHEIRLSTSHLLQPEEHRDPSVAYQYFESFFNAILEALERYIISTQGCGSILEYCYQDKIVAFCHLVGKGQTLRGQWFYASNEASRYLLWFHSVWYMVNYACLKNQQQKDDISITAIDLGPNGIDGRLEAHAALKTKYGFLLYEDWPGIADYRGRFWTIGEGQGN